MKKSFENIRKGKLVYTCFILNIILLILALLVGILFIENLPKFIPVFNQMPWGYARLGLKLEFFIPIILTFLIFIVNIRLGFFLKSKNSLLFRFSFLTSMLISFFNLIFTIRIIFLIK